MGHRVRFVIVAGPPCAGKSFVARRIANEFGAPHLEMDRFRDRLLPFSDQRLEDRELAYRAMHFTAELMAPYCPTLVLDATYTAQVCRIHLAEMAERLEASLFVIECHVSAQLAVERFLRRDTHPAVDLTANRVARLAAAYRYFAGAYPIGAIHAVNDELSGAIRFLDLDPLGADKYRLWCLQGQPRDDTRPSASEP
jgi:predicted kinase